ncbi:MAG: hypothetical protein K0V04_13040, partial [Deltaproteobacteria bacterium]|nr:hypothetical protein [Deltaproteobacteria bacterium]
MLRWLLDTSESRSSVSTARGGDARWLGVCTGAMLMVSMGCGPSTGQPSGSGSTGASPERASTTTAVGASETTVGGGGTVDGADSTDVGDESPADGTTDGGTTEGPPQWVCSEDSFDFACTADQQSTLLEGMTPLGLVSLSLSYRS